MATHYSYEATGSLFMNGKANTPCFGYEGSGSLISRGASRTGVSGRVQAFGRLRLRGYATITLFANPVPNPITPLFIGGMPTPKVPPKKLLRAYSREAAINGWFNNADSAFVAFGTATSYSAVNRRQAQPGTEPHFGLLITEN